jgi:uncharacterized protein (DUF2164 family)
MKRKFDTFSKEIERQCVDAVITRIEEIESDTVGVIAAQDVIDIVVQTLGPEIYNMGVRDTKKLLQDRFSDIETGIDLLEQ